jgi:hypothetical protein
MWVGRVMIWDLYAIAVVMSYVAFVGGWHIWERLTGRMELGRSRAAAVRGPVPPPEGLSFDGGPAEAPASPLDRGGFLLLFARARLAGGSARAVVLGDASPRVEEVTLRFAKSDSSSADDWLREVTFRYAKGGAPRIVSYEPRLASGDYLVEIEIHSDDTRRDQRTSRGSLPAERRRSTFPRRARFVTGAYPDHDRSHRGDRAGPLLPTMGKRTTSSARASRTAVARTYGERGDRRDRAVGLEQGNDAPRRRADDHRQGTRQRSRPRRRHRLATPLRARSDRPTAFK